MGLRFHKSVKIGKGMKINFSKSGVGASFGIPGFSYSVGKKGSYINAGIPGTGISYRKKLGSSSSKNRNSSSSRSSSSPCSYSKALEKQYQQANISIQHYDDGTVGFFAPDGTEITNAEIIKKIKTTATFKESARNAKEDLKARNAQKVYEFNANVDDIINHYKFAELFSSLPMFQMRLDKLKVKTYERVLFSENKPSEEEFRATLKKEAETKFKTLIPWKLSQIKHQRAEYIEQSFSQQYPKLLKQWECRRQIFESEQTEIEQAKNEQFRIEYEEERSALEAAIHGDECYIDLAIQMWLNSVELPLDFSVSFQYYPEKKLLAIDIDLPEINDIPQQRAKQMANGTMKIVNKSRKDVCNDYVECVFGMAAFFASHMGNVSPIIEKFLVSGYTQRRNSKTGDLQDEYVYSIVFERYKFNEIKPKSSTAKDLCLSFKNRCNILSSGTMKAIVPYNVEEV